MKKKIITIILMAVLCFTGMMGISALAEESEEPTALYIKNSYTSGAYMYEEDGLLKYGIPVSAQEDEFKWVFTEYDGYYLITNYATGHSITLSGGIGARTNVKQVTSPSDADLWDLDVTLPSDEAQNITSVSSSYKGAALHIIEVTDGYVVSEQITSSLTYGEAQWCLFEESEINFEGVVRDGFCISYGGMYFTAKNGSVVLGTPTEPDDNYIWEFEVTDGGKYIYNSGADKYLSVSGETLSFTDKSQATIFELFVSNSAVISYDGGVLGVKSISGGLTCGSSSSLNSEFGIVLASSVSVVLGDIKLDGIYTLTNSWFSMYMLDDGGVATYGNSNPDNKQIQWEIIYDSATGYSALRNVGRDEYLYLSEGSLVFSSDIVYYWKVLRSSNDLYPNAIRFQSSENTSVYLHMENTTGQLECSSSVQGTWGSPHWEPSSYDGSATATMEETTIQTETWFRIKSVYSDNLYFYQTNGGFAYGTVSENDARGHWEFISNGVGYYIYNRSYEMYLSSLGNGYLTKTESQDDATVFGVKNYLTDGTYLIYEINDTDYLASYLNIEERDSIVHLSLVSVDIKETRWIIEVAPEEIETNQIVESNTVTSTFTESGEYSWDGTDGLTVEHYGSYVRVSRQDGKYLKVNSKGKSSWKKFTNDYDSDFYFTYETAGDNLIITHGDFTVTLEATGTDRQFNLSDGLIVGKQSTISVYAATGGEYSVTVNTVTQGINVTVYVNGFSQITFRSGETDSITLTLTKGNNVIKFTRTDAVDSFVIHSIISSGYQGASQGITSYELEDCTTNADVVVDSRERNSMPSEATGRSYVYITSITEYVEVTLLNDANAMTLRYSVPDTADGTGKEYTLSLYVDGKEVTNLVLSSEYAHLYKNWDYTNDPSDGYHHVYFDEVTYVFDEILPAGTVIRLRRDYTDQADYYALDLLETEVIADGIAQPEGALSVTDYGAIADDGTDDSAAFIRCIEAAAQQKKAVYIPAGEYEVHTSITISANGLTICGAGYWYTTVNGLELKISGSNVSIYSIRFMGDHNTRRDEIDSGCIEIYGTNEPSGLTIANCWIDHYKCGAWLNYVDQVFISGNRIRYTYADGINLHAGVVDAVVENNSIRSTGDDGIAEWSESSPNTNLTFRYNNIENPWLANCIALYGGTDLYVYNNICKDTAYVGAGVNISTNFVATNFMGEVKVMNNLMIRCGSDDESTNKDVGAIWFNMITGYDAYASMEVKYNVITDSTHQGISFAGTSIVCSLVIEENWILDSGSYGIDISSDFNGKMLIKNNTITGSMLEEILEGYSERNAEVVICDDVVELQTDNTAYIALWCVAGVLLAGSAGLAALLVCSVIRRRKKG